MRLDQWAKSWNVAGYESQKPLFEQKSKALENVGYGIVRVLGDILTLTGLEFYLSSRKITIKEALTSTDVKVEKLSPNPSSKILEIDISHWEGGSGYRKGVIEHYRSLQKGDPIIIMVQEGVRKIYKLDGNLSLKKDSHIKIFTNNLGEPTMISDSSSNFIYLKAPWVFDLSNTSFHEKADYLRELTKDDRILIGDKEYYFDRKAVTEVKKNTNDKKLEFIETPTPRIRLNFKETFIDYLLISSEERHREFTG